MKMLTATSWPDVTVQSTFDRLHTHQSLHFLMLDSQYIKGRITLHLSYRRISKNLPYLVKKIFFI